MATAYSTLYHDIKTMPNAQLSHQEKHNDLFLSNCFIANTGDSRSRGVLRNSFSVDNLYCKKNFECNNNSVFTCSTPRVRKTSSILRDIIVESVSENMETFEDKFMDHENNNNVLYTDDDITQHGSERREKASSTYSKTRHPKKIYMHRKHHSDFVFQIDHHDNYSKDDLVDGSDMKAREALLASDDSVDVPRHLRADSSITNGSGNKIRKSSSQRDITDTQMYKDIYTDNLRLYGFLVAKKLGLSQKSPDQLRRCYQKGRKKAMERRERANSSASEPRVEENSTSTSIPITRERSSTASSTDSNASTSPGSTSDLRLSRYTSSLTDISNIIILEKHKKSTSTSVIRRRKGNKLPADPIKRLSAPLINPVALADLDTMTVSSLRKQMASLSVPDLSQRICEPNQVESTPSTASQHRKLSDETSKRHQEAKARQEWRMSRIKSFEGVLSQASSLMRDMKTKQSNGKTLSGDVIDKSSKMVDDQREQEINK